MALRHLDSVQNYSSATDLVAKYNNPGALTTGLSVISSGGRFGGPCVQMNSLRTITLILDSQSTWIVNYAINLNQAPGSTTVIAEFVDSATVQVDFRITSAGNIVITRNGSTLATSAGTISFGSWNYFEFKVVIHPSTGSAELKVNGVSFVSVSGANTRASANSSADRITWKSYNVTLFQDVIVLDGTGSSPVNDFVGEHRVNAQFPDGAGNHSQWTPSTGSNFQCVDDAAPNADTDYVSSDTVGHRDSYTFNNNTLGGTILGIQVCHVSRKDDIGTRQVQSFIRSNGVNTDLSTKTLSTSYEWTKDIRDTDPDTGVAWTESGFNAAEVGIHVVA